MAKGDHLSRHQQGIVRRYYDNQDTTVLQKLAEVVSDLYVCEGTAERQRLWNTVARALLKTNANPARITRVMSEQNLVELAQIVAELNGSSAPLAAKKEPETPAPGAAAVASAATGEQAAPAAPPAIPPETLKQAMKAFKKRIKLTRLDEESSLGRVGNPMTGGKHSDIVAIIPPNQYPPEVWKELARQGRLKATGGGFYQVAGG